MKRSRGLLLAITVVSAILITAGAELRHARTVTSELAAEAHIRVIHAAQASFLDQYGRYAVTLAELGVPGTTDGYIFGLAHSAAGYAISANPKVFDSTGRRTFFSDQTRTIHQNWGRDAANARSPALN
jgi:type IV pilus assembly protein PilA